MHRVPFLEALKKDGCNITLEGVVHRRNVLTALLAIPELLVLVLYSQRALVSGNSLPSLRARVVERTLRKFWEHLPDCPVNESHPDRELKHITAYTIPCAL